MQTILGSGGVIGIELAKSLTEYTDHIRLVSRNPQKVKESDELFKADLLNFNEVSDAVKGSEIVYLTAGLKYSYKVWKRQWPLLIKNVIGACLNHNARLVFFDNIYMYDGSDLNPITEKHPINPLSKKGKVRAGITQMIWDAVEKDGLHALIARAADFYGPSIKNTSLLTEMVLNPLSKGKKANWMASGKYKHSFTYTPDAGKATALLGNTNDAYGQVWHLPSASNPFAGKEWIENIAKELGVKPKYQLLKKPFLRLMGIFIPVLGEMVEMMYQYDRDYVFSSEKFEKRFDFKPTPYLDGIREIIRIDYQK